MNWFACYLAISCCNKFSIFLVFIREPGQNVRCHEFGGPCIVIKVAILVLALSVSSLNCCLNLDRDEYLTDKIKTSSCALFMSVCSEIFACRRVLSSYYLCSLMRLTDCLLRHYSLRACKNVLQYMHKNIAVTLRNLV